MEGTTRIDELEQKFIENPRRYFAPLANEYRKAGNPHQAIAICRAHLGQLPGHMSGQIVYGQSLFDGGEHEEASRVFQNALAMDPENVVALRHLGDISLRNGNQAEARRWYGRLLEIDPRDSAVVALVHEMDESREAARSESAAEQVPEIDTDLGNQEMPRHEDNEGDEERERIEAGGEASHAAAEEEDRLIAEEIGYPVPPPRAFVTPTMAELYLAQGFRDRAIGVFRQLVEERPNDTQLLARLNEIEAADRPPVENRREEQPSVESPAPDDAGTGAAPAETPEHEQNPGDAGSVESPDADSGVSDSPPVEQPSEEEGSLEAPATADPESASVEAAAAAQPESASAESEAAETPARGPEAVGTSPLTVREFFASLGRRRPSSGAAMTYRSNGDAGADPFSETPLAEDRAAATALAGAFAGVGADAGAASGSDPTRGRGARERESEEDVARFRAWLDGLTGE